MKEKLINVAIDNFKEGELPVDYIDTDIVMIESLEGMYDVVDVKFNLNFIVACFGGEATFSIAGGDYTLKDGESLMCPSGTIISNMRATPDIKVSVLGLTDRIVQLVLKDKIDIWNRALYSNAVHIATRPMEHNPVGDHFNYLLKAMVDWKTHPFHEQMVRCMLQMIILTVCAYFMRSDDNTEEKLEEKSPQGRVIFNKFMEMLKDEKVKHQPIYYYSNKLYITPKYLSHVCKEISGKTANEFIQLAVMADIDYYLLHTTMSVKEIAQQLGFPTLSFFGKYVKSHVGLSPNDYRKERIKG